MIPEPTSLGAVQLRFTEYRVIPEAVNAVTEPGATCLVVALVLTTLER